MAFYGLSFPTIAKLDTVTGKYTDGFKCGKAVSSDVTPNYNEASLHGDDELAEYVKDFKDADVTLGVTEFPIEAATVMFGHKVDTETNSITYGTQDVASYVGYGFYASEINEGVTKYTACWLPKVKFADTAESYSTKGESIEFKTPSISGKATADASGNWKYKQTFATIEEARAWLETKAGIKAAVTK